LVHPSSKTHHNVIPIRTSLGSHFPFIGHDETWLGLASDFAKTYHGAVGLLEELALFVEHTGKQ